MLCGKAVVATDDPDNSFIREINAGLLIDPEESNEVANAIIELLKNDEFREQMGNNGRKYVLENRSWEAVAREIEGTIRALITGEQ